jgi:transcriptional regulator with XRE-family HTH domain
LGSFLRAGREGKGLTLRAAEEVTGVSNAYLSQLESGKIAQPSPAVLHKLCLAYNVSYAQAMQIVGYPLPEQNDAVNVINSGSMAATRLAARFGEVTSEEEEELSEYLHFIRTRKRR